MSGEKTTYTVNSLDPPVRRSKQTLFNYWNGELTEQKHMRDLIETIFDEIADLQVALATESFVVVASDEVTALTAGTAKATFHMPYDFEVSAVEASLTVAQASGSTFTVDITVNGTSILSTKITIDNTELTSVTAAVQPVISNSSIPDNAKVEIDIDQIGNGSAVGLKVNIIGTQV